MASCCAPGAARPIPASSAANARRKPAASGPTASTASMSTRMTMSGSPGMPAAPATRAAAPWTTNEDGGDGFVLKFDMDGNFKMRIGGTPQGPTATTPMAASTARRCSISRPTWWWIPKTNRLYIADGYGNRRVLIVDADTGKYIGHFGAYGNNPVDDAAAAAAGPWIEDYDQRQPQARLLPQSGALREDRRVTARSMSATAATTASRCSTRTIPRWASPAAILTASRQMRLRRRAIHQRAHQHRPCRARRCR